MKITIRHRDSELIIDEEDVGDGLIIKWSDQNEQLMKLLSVATEQLMKLQKLPRGLKG